jgi:hypothetical protein
MRTNLRNIALRLDVHSRVKALANQTGIDIQEIINNALLDWLDGDLHKAWLQRRAAQLLHSIDKQDKADSTAQHAAITVEQEPARTIGSSTFVAPPGMEHLYK